MLDKLFLTSLTKEQLDFLEVITANMTADPAAMLRRLHTITIVSVQRELTEKLAIFTVAGHLGSRFDSATGVSALEGLTGLELANAIKAAETSAKSRLTYSLLGYGFHTSIKEETSAGLSEPQPLDTPQVNNGKAEVIPDTRPDTFVPVTPVCLEIATVPAVTEEAIGGMHQASTVLSAQDQPSQADAPTPKPVAPTAPQAQAGFFDDEPTEVPGAASIPTIAEQIAEVPVGSTYTVGPVMPVAEVGQTVLPEAGQPTPVKDIVIPPPSANEKLSLQQYRGFTARCTQLVRQLGAKAPKGTGDLLLPWLRKRLGVQDLQLGNALAWEEALGELEKAKDTSATVFILKGGK